MTMDRKHFRPAFSVIELLVVMTIIVVLVSIAVPAARSISRNNDENQAANVVRSAITTARSIAISQHRMAGVVFFEETPTYSLPVNASQTAMQIFVEDFNQAQYSPIGGLTVFVYSSPSRTYLPAGIKVATLNDVPSSANAYVGINTADANNKNAQARAIVFDAEGRLITRGGLAAPDPRTTDTTLFPGQYPKPYGDWRFLKPNGQLVDGSTGYNATSSPAFFLYSKTEMDAQNFPKTAAGDDARADWLKRRSSIVVVNVNTGTVLIDKRGEE